MTNASDVSKRFRRPLVIRLVLFGVFLVFVGWSSGFFQSTWTGFFPLTCAEGNSALFFLDFNEVPVRLNEQFNLCTGVWDGECTRSGVNLVVRGECSNERMHGPWSLKDIQSGAVWWSGTYCDGLPCGEFHRRLDDDHEFVFHVKNVQLHGPARIWEVHDKRLFELSGYYEYGKRTGRWVRHVDPGHGLHSVSIYDNGSVTTTTFHCQNGVRKEVRGQTTFFFDAQGNPLRNDPADPPLCLLP